MDDETTVEEIEAPPPTAAQMWDTALDEPAEQEDVAAPEEAAAAPEVAAPVETTAEAHRRILKFKFDKEEREFDIDENWKDEAKRAQMQALLEKGHGFDRVVARTKQEATTQGQSAALAWVRAQGYEPRQDPNAPGGWKLVPNAQAATPAAEPTAPVATPEPTQEIAELQRLAYGDDDIEPRQQIDAIRKLAKLDADAAAKAQFQAFEDWKKGLEGQVQEAQTRKEQEQAERTRQSARTEVQAEIDKVVKARAKSFDGPNAQRQIQRITRLAMMKAETDAKTIEEVLAIVNEAADDLDAQWEHRLKATASKPRAPKPAPSLDGTPSGSSAKSAKDIDWSKGSAWDEAIEASFTGAR